MVSRSLASAALLLGSSVFASCGSSGGDDAASSDSAEGTGGAATSAGGSQSSGGSAGRAAMGTGGANGTSGHGGAAGSSAGAGGSQSGAAGKNSGGNAGAPAAGGAGAGGQSQSAGGASGQAGSAGSAAAGEGGSGGSGQAGAGGFAGSEGGAAGSGGGGCVNDDGCVSMVAAPRCDASTGTCVACLGDNDPVPPGVCSHGVCALVKPKCLGGAWVCDGPGYEPTETKCDGYDNDCNGKIDEGCPVCSVPLATVQSNLASIWDIDFDFQCNTYLTTVISGPDYTRVVPNDGTPPTTYFGNANQNMGFGLVDPDPGHKRVVVLYSCQNASCLANNGITLLYTCDSTDPACGCNGQANCPGFLNSPFLNATAKKGSLTFNGFEFGAPNGMTVGPGNKYYVGNWQPGACESDMTKCVACDPSHPGVTCGQTDSCCDTTPMGRLAAFTLPEAGVDPTVRVDAIYPGEEIYGLATGRSGLVFVGTYETQTSGNLYRFNPVSLASTLIQTFPGPVFSITEDPTNTELYLELRASPKIVRLSPGGGMLALPPGVPSDPPGEGVLQIGPDHKLYRLQGAVDKGATLDAYDLP